MNDNLIQQLIDNHAQTLFDINFTRNLLIRFMEKSDAKKVLSPEDVEDARVMAERDVEEKLNNLREKVNNYAEPPKVSLDWDSRCKIILP